MSIVKRNLYDYLATFMTCGRSKEFFKNIEYIKNTLIIYNRIFTEKQIEQFKLKLRIFHWVGILASEDKNKAYIDFLNIFSTYYNESFPEVEIN